MISSVPGDFLTFFLVNFHYFTVLPLLILKIAAFAFSQNTQTLAFIVHFSGHGGGKCLMTWGPGAHAVSGATQACRFPRLAALRCHWDPALGVFCLGGLVWLLAVPTAGILLHSWPLTLVPGPEPPPPPRASCFQPVCWASS